MRATLAAAGSALLVLIGSLALSPAAGATPGAATGAEGQTLTVSQVDGLNPDGAKVAVAGSGYNTEKGIYVAFCVVPVAGQTPTPCGGGADMSGSGGLSGWISSNPPSYGRDLVTPYGPGGTFAVELTLTPMIDSVDCRTTACAVVTRADHTRLTDRTQDVIVPVTWGEPGATSPDHTPIEPATPTPSASEPPSATQPPGASETASEPLSPNESGSGAARTDVAIFSKEESDSDGGGGVLIALGAAAAAIVLAAGFIGVRGRAAQGGRGRDGGGSSS